MADVLRARGWTLVGTNVRVGRDEVDLLARDGDTLVVVEVRTRKNARYGHPLETISPRKAAHLRRAAMRLMQDYDCRDVRIDVASVIGDEIEIIPNAVDFTETL